MTTITNVEAFVVRLPSPIDNIGGDTESWASNPNGHPALADNHPGDITTEYPPLWRTATPNAANESVVVRIRTADGVVGWGEAHTPLAAEITRQVIQRLLAPLLIGQNATDIHPLWERMYSVVRQRGHNGGYALQAISAVDIALWDAAGKTLGVPITKLLGGQLRDRVPVYASSLSRLHAHDFEAGLVRLVERAVQLQRDGYRAIKVELGLDLARDLEVLRGLREALGTAIDLAVDVNGAYDFALARRTGEAMSAVGGIRWLEDPLLPELKTDFVRLADYLDVAVAGGKWLATRWTFNDYLAASALDIAQPNVAHAGGISECKRIAELADLYGVPIAPHLSAGTIISVAATLQWAAACTNLMTCAYPLGQSNLLGQPFVIEDGYIRLPSGAGLGIEVDEAAVRQWQVFS